MFGDLDCRRLDNDDAEYDNDAEWNESDDIFRNKRYFMRKHPLLLESQSILMGLLPLFCPCWVNFNGFTEK